MPFTAHNIVLPDGSETKPGDRPLAEAPRAKAFVNLLQCLFPGGLTGISIADLGCLEGGYTVEFARLGMDALGIEVRPSHFQNCLHVASSLALPNLRFVQDDVWNIARYGDFDVILCCGLLYHLDRPREFLRLMSKCCRRLAIINTRYAEETDDPSPNLILSEPTTNEGLRGRWFTEYPEEAPAKQDTSLWRAWENRKSFWPMHHAIIFALQDASFPVVLEQFYGAINPSKVKPIWNRTTFVALKA